MKLFGFNISRETAAAQQKSLSPTIAEWRRGEDLDREGLVLTNAYQQVVWVYRAINVLAEQVANVPFLFSPGERGRENLVTRGRLLDFYANPHPQIDRFQYWELRIIWLMLRGESIRIPIYSDSSRSNARTLRRSLSRILILDPAHFQHVIENHQLIGWRYTAAPNAPLESQ